MSAEACADRRGALGAAALGRLDEHEQLALQAHLDGCPACREELAELRSTVELLDTVDVAHLGGPNRRAPLTLGDDVVERVRDARLEHTTHRSRRRVGTVAAAVVGLAAALAAVVGVSMHSGPAGHVAAERTVLLRGQDANAKATIIQARDGTDVSFRGRLRDAADSTDPYWLWLTDASGHRLAAATFRDGKDGSFSIRGHGAIPYSSVRRVWVTDQQNHVVLDTSWSAATKS
ncbi:MAG TPA: zf-HC2 domain-containing protein [Acidimicrobiia bacterium]